MDKIAVLDFGGQYAHLIANRIRRQGVFTEIRPPSVSVGEARAFAGIVFSGGPSSVYSAKRPEFNEALLGAGIPILGICYGHQLMCHLLGGNVQRGHVREYGIAALR